MEDTKKMNQRGIETATLWAETHQRALRDLAELSATTAKEGVRLYAELQQSGIEALREAQAATLRWQSTWSESARDPFGWYQRALAEGVEGAQKAFRLMEGNAQAITKSAERLQTAAEGVGKDIQENLTQAVAKMREVCAA